MGGSPTVYGGNTPCVSCIASDGALLVLDAGTGIYHLGKKLESRKEESKLIRMLFSHVHWDHIQGFPLFSPANSPEVKLLIYGGPPQGGTWEQALKGQMDDPYFPLPFSSLGADITFQGWPDEGPMALGPFTVSRTLTNHPGGGYSYRICCDHKIFVYATDTEHPASGVDEGLFCLARNADLLLYDATFFPDEYPAREGWGHSTWQHGIALARAASVRRLLLFHHDPSHDDESLAEMEWRAQQEFSSVEAAREGPVILD